MENRNSRRPSTHRCNRPWFSRFTLLFPICVLATGCGAPGEPNAPSPPIPTAISDLSAQQNGDGVQLTFTMPTKTIRGERLIEPPSIEILRGRLKPDRSPDTNSFRAVYTIPGSLVNDYKTEDRVRFVDPIAPADIHTNPDGAFAYRVRTRASKKRASPDSNNAIVKVLPVPERVASARVKITESAIELSWTAPSRTFGGDPLTAIPEYHIYRGVPDPRTSGAAAKDSPREKWISPPTLVGKSAATTFSDVQFDFGKTYAYFIRSTMEAGGNLLESGESEPIIVAAEDTFPPAVPQGVVAATIADASPASPEIDLSWSINTESDLAGYRVYRSEQQAAKGELLTPDPLLSPAYRDTSIQPGHHYWYVVTAVDRSGNESAPSVPVAVDVAQPSS
jgi:hypothetical protein